MGVTKKDIARALDISLITVHRALNNTGYVSKELKSRVLEYAKKVQYVPHKASQVLVRNKTRRIAVFSSSLPQSFWNDIRTGVSVGAEQIRHFRYEVEYHRIADYDSDSYGKILQRELKRGVDAVAFVHQWMYDMASVISRLDRAEIPYVTLNVDAPSSNRICYVGPDYRAGGRLAAEYIGKALVHARKPKVLVINTKADLPEGTDAPDINTLREEGFLAVMAQTFSGVAVETGLVARGSARKSMDGQLRRLLEQTRSEFDAVYLIPAYNTEFLSALGELRNGPVTSVVHDMDPTSRHHLKNGVLSAIIYQNPILQGYYAVKTLEHALETGTRPDDVEVIIEHSLVLNENRNLYRNHFLFAQGTDAP